MGVIARVGMLRDIGSWRNFAVFALAVMAMFASAPKAGAGFVCSSSTVHILFDSGSSECVGASGTADTSISYGTPALAGDASMAIRVGQFSGYAHIGGDHLVPNAVTFSASATGQISDVLTPLGAANGTPLTLLIPFHVTGADEPFWPQPSVVNRFAFTCGAFIGDSGGSCGNEQIASTSNNWVVSAPARTAPAV